MGWDKNTVNLSQIDAIMATLDEIGHKYEVSNIGKVIGMGRNDELADTGIGQKDYTLRRLDFGDRVYLEKMVRDVDCDSDDFIVSEGFYQSTMPDEWCFEEYTTEGGETQELEEKTLSFVEKPCHVY